MSVTYKFLGNFTLPSLSLLLLILLSIPAPLLRNVYMLKVGDQYQMSGAWWMLKITVKKYMTGIIFNRPTTLLFNSSSESFRLTIAAVYNFFFLSQLMSRRIHIKTNCSFCFGKNSKKTWESSAFESQNWMEIESIPECKIPRMRLLFKASWKLLQLQFLN